MSVVKQESYDDKLGPVDYRCDFLCINILKDLLYKNML